MQEEDYTLCSHFKKLILKQENRNFCIIKIKKIIPLNDNMMVNSEATH
jgi:DNA-directed RNA polymerase subunit L